MIYLNKVSFFFIFIFLLQASTLSAQRKDFSGIWVLKDQKSISGRLYSNGVPKQIKVTQQLDKLDIEKRSVTLSGENITVNELFLSNGKPFESLTPANRKKNIVIKWNEAGNSFTSVTLFYTPSDSSKIDFKITDIWALSDMASLIITRKNENFSNGEIWESRAEYEKQ